MRKLCKIFRGDHLKLQPNVSLVEHSHSNFTESKGSVSANRGLIEELMRLTKQGAESVVRRSRCRRAMPVFVGYGRASLSIFALLVFISVVPLEGAFSDRLERVWLRADREEEPSAYLATLTEPKVSYSNTTYGSGGDISEQQDLQAPPTFAGFRDRYARIIAMENHIPIVEEDEPEPVVLPQEPEEPKRRTVVRSEFDMGVEVPGAFPRPKRDTVSFEDIYLFFPVGEGDAKKVGLVRGEGNRSIFSPPSASGLKSGVTFETVTK